MKLTLIVLTVLLSASLTDAASAAGTSPVDARTPKMEARGMAADNGILIKFARGMDEAHARAFLRKQGMKARNVFRNLSKANARVYLSAVPVAAYRAPARGSKIQKLVQALASSSTSATSTSKDSKIQMLAQALTATSQVDAASPNHAVHVVQSIVSNQEQPAAPRRDAVVPSAVPNDPLLSMLWGMQNLDMPSAWDISTGSESVVVFVIDTGIDTDHPDLLSNLWSNPGEIAGDGIDNDGNGHVDDMHGIDTVNDDADPEDDQGHGTHCAGTIGAQGNDERGIVGVNWDVKIGACKFLNVDGGTSEGAALCFDYVLGLKNAGVNVVATNNSWEDASYSEVLHDAIQANIEAGVLPVMMAGHLAFPAYPCAYEFPDALGDSICVASIDRDSNLAWFSNYSHKFVDIGAPGVNILSTVPDFIDASYSYASWSGTGMAAAHVTGMAALIAAKKTGSSLTDIRSTILCSAVAADSLTDKVATNGHANALRAFQVEDEKLCSFVSVTLTSPAAHESVSGIVSISADTSNEARTERVEFFVDDELIDVAWTAPYLVAWNALEAAPGLHSIKAVATDSYEKTAADAVDVYVTSGHAGKALVLDLVPDNNSCKLIGAALARNGATPVHADSIGSSIDPAMYPMSFVCLGYRYYNSEFDMKYSKHVLTSLESDVLTFYLDNGGKLYMEGGDTWAYDPDLPIHDYFGIVGIDSDFDFDFDYSAIISGVDGGLAEGISFAVAAVERRLLVDHLQPTNGGFFIWEKSRLGLSNYVVGVSNQTENYRTIGCSFEFANIPEKSTQTQVMAAYMAFFDSAIGHGVINFEIPIEPSLEIHDGYKGFSWENCYVTDPLGSLPSGYENGITSGRYVGFNNGYNEPCTISSASEPVKFGGGYFTGAWRNGLTMTAQGYKGETLTGTVSATVNYAGPTWIDFSSLGEIDALVLSSAGGTDATPDDHGEGEQFVMDDLVVGLAEQPIAVEATGVAAVKKLTPNKDFARIDVVGMARLGEAVKNYVVLHFRIGATGGEPAYSFSTSHDDVEIDGETLHYLGKNEEVTCNISDERCFVKIWNADMSEGNLSEDMSVVLRVGLHEYVGMGSWDKRDASENTIYRKR